MDQMLIFIPVVCIQLQVKPKTFCNRLLFVTNHRYLNFTSRLIQDTLWYLCVLPFIWKHFVKLSDLVFLIYSMKLCATALIKHKKKKNNHTIANTKCGTLKWLPLIFHIHSTYNQNGIHNVNNVNATFSLANRVMNTFSSFYHSIVEHQMNAKLCHNCKVWTSTQDHKNFKCTHYFARASLCFSFTSFVATLQHFNAVNRHWMWNPCFTKDKEISISIKLGKIFIVTDILYCMSMTFIYIVVHSNKIISKCYYILVTINVTTPKTY